MRALASCLNTQPLSSGKHAGSVDRLTASTTPSTWLLNVGSRISFVEIFGELVAPVYLGFLLKRLNVRYSMIFAMYFFCVSMSFYFSRKIHLVHFKFMINPPCYNVKYWLKHKLVPTKCGHVYSIIFLHIIFSSTYNDDILLKLQVCLS